MSEASNRFAQFTEPSTGLENLHKISYTHVFYYYANMLHYSWACSMKKEDGALIFSQMLSSLEWWWENPKCLVFLHFWHHSSDCNSTLFFLSPRVHPIKRVSLDVFQISSQKHFADTIEFSLTKQQSNWHSNITGCRLEWLARWQCFYFLHNLNVKQKGILTNQYHM